LYILSYLYKNIVLASTSRPNISQFIVHDLHALPKKYNMLGDGRVCVRPERVVLWLFTDCRKKPVHGNPQRMGPINITATQNTNHYSTQVETTRVKREKARKNKKPEKLVKSEGKQTIGVSAKTHATGASAGKTQVT